MGSYGQFPGGGFAGDENARAGFGDPRQGFETCGIVEFMASHQLLGRITGDPVWADRCEDLAFNSLPAALDPDGKGVHYITSANSVDLDNTPKTQGQFQNGFAMQAYMPGVDQYRCCPHNYGMGWPYFTEELWLATPDNGLAAAMYAPSSGHRQGRRRHHRDHHRDHRLPLRRDGHADGLHPARRSPSRSTCASRAGARPLGSPWPAARSSAPAGPAYTDGQPHLEQRRHGRPDAPADHHRAHLDRQARRRSASTTAR